MNYRITTGVLLLFAILQTAAGAQTYERTRHESRTFRVFDNTILEIYNKYGNIHLFTWDSDSVRIEVDVTVRASKESKADKLYENIDLEFSGSRYYVIARTTFGQNQGGLLEELSDLANSMFSAGSKAQVDYHVHLPGNLQVRLENKFGNVYAGDHSGKFDVDLSNGDLKANDLLGPAELNLSFGNAVVNSMRSGRITGSYLEMDIGRAEELKVNGKSSTYNIAKVDVLKLDSRRDKFYVDEVSSLTGEASFSYLTIRALANVIRLKTEYGELKVKGIDPGFAGIEADSKYTDILFQVSPQLSSRVHVQHTASTGIFYPDAFSGLSVKTGEEKDSPSVTSGTIGNPEKASSEIRVTTQSGKVTFQEEIELF